MSYADTQETLAYRAAIAAAIETFSDRFVAELTKDGAVDGASADRKLLEALARTRHEHRTAFFTGNYEKGIEVHVTIRFGPIKAASNLLVDAATHNIRRA